MSTRANNNPLSYQVATIFMIVMLLLAAVPISSIEASSAVSPDFKPTSLTIPFTLPLNADVVINRTAGVTDNTQVGIDGEAVNSYCYLTQSAAAFYSAAPSGIPDNGLIAANAFHPAVQLAVNNADGGNNARKITPAGPLTFTIDVPDDKYLYMHVFGATGNGTSSFSLTFNYSDATSTTTTVVNLRDWFNDFAQTTSEYFLIDNLDRMACNVTGYENLDIPAIFGHRFGPNVNKTLQTVTVTVSNLTGGERAIFFGAVGESAPKVTINQAAGQVDPTSASPILFDVVFDETVTGFINSDVDLSLSTAPGTLSAVVSGSGANYTVSVSGMTGDGTVVARIPANAAQNAATIGNQASTSTDNQVTVKFTPTITSAAPLGGATGVIYTHNYTANGATPITFSLTAGALPPGLTLSSAGVISGTPTVLGTYTGTVTASNGILPNSLQNFSITINQLPAITSPNNASFTLGSADTFTVTATGSPAPTLSMTGSLPAGVTFTPATGVLAGTPAAGTGGSYPLTFTASNGVLPDAVQNFTLVVTDGPSFTSTNNTSFNLGLPGTFTVTAAGSPSPTFSMTGSLPAGVTFTSATGILAGTPAAGTAGTYPLTFTATNGVLPDAVQNFTLTVKNGPVVVANGINSVPVTGDGYIGNNEIIKDTLGITKLTVQFDQNVFDPAGNTDPKDVTNPANYMLVMGSSTGVFQTVSCLGGVVAPDVAISVDNVAYSNGGGSGPFIATLNINGGNPLNVVGFYRLYVCGTTSILDAASALELAGDGVNPGTDFLLSFRVRARVDNSSNNTATTVATTAAVIPVTGFAPNRVTDLPAQPADKAYKSMGEIRIEIPTLGINYPIVGAMLDKNTWDLTWLKDSVAYLEGSAYPTLGGNTVLTAHVMDANNNLGPFSDIKGMQKGQKIYIHANGQIYVYQVQENKKILPTNISAAFQHEEYSWITLVTCEEYNAKSGLYKYRRMVRAVLVSVISEK